MNILLLKQRGQGMVQEKYEASQAQMERDSMVLIEGKWIVQNLQCLRRQIQVPVMAVVKNNGYGLGLEEYALYLQALGIRHFGVKDAEEALRLRRAGITEEICLLAPVCNIPQLLKLIRAKAILCIDSPFTAQCARRAGYLSGQMPRAQLALDTGLGRYGFLPDQLEHACDAARQFQIVGTYTHFAEPYADAAFTKGQFVRFLNMADGLRKMGVHPGMLHCCATGGALRFR